MRNFLNLLVLLCFFAPATYAGSNHALFSKSTPVSLEKLVIKTNGGQDIAYNIELAQTPQEHAKGLMHRQFMPEYQGMLFIFQKAKIQNFWMKNTLIPLDLLFIDEKGIIQHIHHNAIPHDQSFINSQNPVPFVLEINGGQAKKHGIQIGDKVLHKLMLAQNDIIVY